MRSPRIPLVLACTLAAATLSAVPATTATAAPEAHAAILVTHDGGVLALDADDLSPLGQITTSSRPSVSPAADGRHFFLVQTDKGLVQIGDLQGTPHLNPLRVNAVRPIHVVSHGNRTAVFDDGTGTIQILRNSELDKASVSVRMLSPFGPHHGVALPISGGDLLVSVPGTEPGKRVGVARVNAKSGKVERRWNNCPQIHGEAEAAGNVKAFGCEDGVFLYKNGYVAKSREPKGAPEGFSSTLAGTEESPIIAGSYNSTHIALVNTRTTRTRLLDLGQVYGKVAWAEDQLVALGTDGALHLIDERRAKVTSTIPVIDAWTKPDDWTAPRPTLTVLGHRVVVSDPATKTLRVVDLESGEVSEPTTLDVQPVGLTAAGPGAGHEH